MATRRRRLLLFAVVAIIAMVLALGVWLLWPQSAINWGNFARIRVGMARVEVEAILGGAERDDSSGPCEVLFDEHVAVAVADNVLGQAAPGAEEPSQVPRVWTSDRLVIRLGLDADDRVIFGHAAPVRRYRESFFNHVRRRIGL